jgi:hypothetical protein
MLHNLAEMIHVAPKSINRGTTMQTSRTDDSGIESEDGNLYSWRNKAENAVKFLNLLSKIRIVCFSNFFVSS